MADVSTSNFRERQLAFRETKSADRGHTSMKAELKSRSPRCPSGSPSAAQCGWAGPRSSAANRCPFPTEAQIPQHRELRCRAEAGLHRSANCSSRGLWTPAAPLLEFRVTALWGRIYLRFTHFWSTSLAHFVLLASYIIIAHSALLPQLV